MKKWLCLVLCLVIAAPCVAASAEVENCRVSIGKTGCGKVTVQVDSSPMHYDDVPINMTLDKGAVVTLTAEADPGYLFTGWYEGIIGSSYYVDNYTGMALSESKSYSVTVNDDTRICAVFAENPEISSVSVSVTVPATGKVFKAEDALSIVSVPSGKHYHLFGAEWLEIREETFTITAGTTYTILAKMETEDGFAFSDSATVNPSGATISGQPEISNHQGDSVLEVHLRFTVPAEAAAPAASTEKVTLSKLKSVKLKALSAKKIEVKWKKLSSKDQKKIQKIQIQYSTDKNFRTGVKTRWAKKTKASYTIKGLKKNTRYWVRIRAYKKEGNTIFVSKWITKNKKTKKK